MQIENDSHFWEDEYDEVGSGIRGTYYVWILHCHGECILWYKLCSSPVLTCVAMWLGVNLLTFYSTRVQRRKSLVVKWMQVMLKNKNVLLYWCAYLSCLQKVLNFSSVWDTSCFFAVFIIIPIIIINFCHRKNYNSCFCKLACICFLNEWTKTNNLMFCWPCILIHLCNKHQLDELFILSLFRHSPSTCFGHICNPSSGGTLCIYNNWCVLCFLVYWLLAGWPANSQSTEKQNTYQFLYIYIYIYIYIYSVPPDDGLQICPKHVEGDWRNNSASSWFL